MADILSDIAIAREQVEACRQMCRDRWECGCTPHLLMRCYAFHECCRLLREAEQRLKDLEKRRESYP